jgi:hypothetical protein
MALEPPPLFSPSGFAQLGLPGNTSTIAPLTVQADAAIVTARIVTILDFIFAPDFDLREELILDLSSKPTDSNSCECLGFCFIAIIQSHMATSILKRAIFMHFWDMKTRIHWDSRRVLPFSMSRRFAAVMA